MLKRVARTPHLQKQNPLLWTKHEKLKFTSLTVSPGTAAVEWFLIMNLLSVQLSSLYIAYCALIMHYMWLLTSAKRWCPCGPDALVNTCLLHWPEASIQWENNSQPVHGIIKTMGQKTTRTVLSNGPRSWWKLEQSVFRNFNRSMSRDQQKCASQAA